MRNNVPLIKCTTCDKEMSSNAPACPNCGEPNAEADMKPSQGAINPKDPVHLLGIVVAVLLGSYILYLVVQTLTALG